MCIRDSVWWTHFPFENSNIVKHRPAIVINDDEIAILAMYVTSKDKETPYSIEITDWEQTGLSKVSWARIDRIISISEWNLDRKIGKLTERDLLKILQMCIRDSSYAVKDIIIDKWIATHKQYEKDDPKMVYYMSMEFLMGRALGNNMINLCAYDEIKEALDELGLDINVIEDQEPDAALGNGGLGRLAACFMDSLATLEYPAYGCGIRYKYGMFKQEIKDGYQVEVPDNWLKDGNPFEIKRSEYLSLIHI